MEMPPSDAGVFNKNTSVTHLIFEKKTKLDLTDSVCVALVMRNSWD